MGEVGVTIRITPEDVNNLEKLKNNLKEEFNVEDIKEEPLAFGLKNLKILVIISDSSGGTDKLENQISNLSGVKDLEIEDVSLI